MYQTMSLPLYSGSFEEYHGWGDLRAELRSSGAFPSEDCMGSPDRKSVV